MGNNRTVRLTAAQAIVRYLQVQYSERDGQRRRLIPGMFGIFGHGNVAGLGQALEEYGDGLPYYQPKNEQAMVHLATGYAKATMRMSTMSCTSSIGPGATNMITGAATATVNRLPVLLFPSDYYATRRQGPVLQQLEHPVNADVSVNDAFRPVSRFFDRITRPEQILTALPEAMRVLTSVIETGAVTVSLPQDVQTMAYEFPEKFFEERYWPIARPAPSPDGIERAAAMIRNARRPAIIAGGGVHYADATEALGRFSNQCGIPVGETHGGKGAGTGAGLLNLGGAGVAGNPAAATVWREADLIIGVGTRFADFVTGSQSAFQDPEVRFISINVTSRDAHKQGALAVEADAKLALEAFCRVLGDYRTPSDWQTRVRALRDDWTRRVQEEISKANGQGRLTQAGMVLALNQFVRSGDTVVAAAGALPGDLLQLWDCAGDRHCLLEFGYSCMGWEIPAAMGVKMAHPGREVYALIGDGTYLMNNTELVTAVQEGIKIVVVIAVNRGFQVIRKLQLATTAAAFGNEFRKREGRAGPLTGAYLDIDFAKNAESLGALALRANSTATLVESLAQASEVRNRPAVIAVEVDPDRHAPASGVWWDISVAETSARDAVVSLRDEYEQEQRRQRFYY